MRFIEKFAQVGAIALFTNSIINKKLIEKSGSSKVFLCEPGFEIVEGIPIFENRENIILSVTMWDKGRKPEIFIDIAKNVSDGFIILAGNWTDKNYMNEFIEKIKTMKLTEKIKVTGPISEYELVNYYKHAKVFIRFGFNENGPGMGSLEAISYGIPLIYNESLGLPTYVKNRDNGFMINPFDVNEITHCVKILLNDVDIWKAISSNNLKLSKEHSWNNQGKKFSILINDILNLNSQNFT